MASVGAELVIVGGHEVGLTDAGSFLPDGKVCGAGIGGFDTVVDFLSLDRGQHALELAQDRDVAVNADQILVREILALLGDGLVIGVDIDVGKVDRAISADLFRTVV